VRERECVYIYRYYTYEVAPCRDVLHQLLLRLLRQQRPILTARLIPYIVSERTTLRELKILVYEALSYKCMRP
jgi:hypothetical protein